MMVNDMFYLGQSGDGPAMPQGASQHTEAQPAAAGRPPPLNEVPTPVGASYSSSAAAQAGAHRSSLAGQQGPHARITSRAVPWRSWIVTDWYVIDFVEPLPVPHAESASRRRLRSPEDQTHPNAEVAAGEPSSRRRHIYTGSGLSTWLPVPAGTSQRPSEQARSASTPQVVQTQPGLPSQPVVNSSPPLGFLIHPYSRPAEQETPRAVRLGNQPSVPVEGSPARSTTGSGFLYPAGNEEGATRNGLPGSRPVQATGGVGPHERPASAAPQTEQARDDIRGQSVHSGGSGVCSAAHPVHAGPVFCPPQPRPQVNVSGQSNATTSGGSAAQTQGTPTRIPEMLRAQPALFMPFSARERLAALRESLLLSQLRDADRRLGDNRVALDSVRELEEQLLQERDYLGRHATRVLHRYCTQRARTPFLSHARPETSVRRHSAPARALPDGTAPAPQGWWPYYSGAGWLRGRPQFHRAWYRSQATPEGAQPDGAPNAGLSERDLSRLPCAPWTMGATHAAEAEDRTASTGSTDEVATPASCREGGCAETPGRARNEYTEFCAICMEAYEEGAMVRFLPCLHAYHQACIDVWLSRSELCPICKQDVGHLLARQSAAVVELSAQPVAQTD
ncbi:hypothetical protein BESB_045940 [Besnoitia besnoiti]|uniref:RING-type E3 ubiquitin transferase n=1 Tax=Besnoitia besnoiti TaxID=94643 RepID=A0A2A9MLR0_BESBE|nr:hypothetical protein BESB_045940 [Besnoitia besnoiti]PFH36402.1 hypothetical protein BESB_045940 [Besnoitia besnoiti]